MRAREFKWRSVWIWLIWKCETHTCYKLQDDCKHFEVYVSGCVFLLIHIWPFILRKLTPYAYYILKEIIIFQKIVKFRQKAEHICIRYRGPNFSVMVIFFLLRVACSCENRQFWDTSITIKCFKCQVVGTLVNFSFATCHMLNFFACLALSEIDGMALTL